MYSIKPSRHRVEKLNNQLYWQKHKQVHQYLNELSDYEETVSELALDIMAVNHVTKFSAPLQNEVTTDADKIDSVKLGLLLNDPPKAEQLSVPIFFGHVDDDPLPTEIVKLKKGYLFFKKDEHNYYLEYHFKLPTAKNVYLDLGRTLPDSLPHLVRDNQIIVSKFVKVLQFILLLKNLL